MHWSFPLFIFIGVFVVSLVGTRLILRVLRDRAILDHPNARSSHSTPTPKGGGIVVIPCIIAAWLITASGTEAFPITLIVAAAALGLAGLSWFDDLRELNPVWRLVAQALAVAMVLLSPYSTALFAEPFFGGLLPPGLDMVVAALLWVWFINLFNFMDGIDGLAGVEAACIGIGIAVVSAAAGLSGEFGVFGVAIAAAALGFLIWNWHPAKIFLGDIGSVPLGFLLGWLLLWLAANGQWPAAVILPLYYLADASITLLKRFVRGEKVWQAHRQHFYQQALAHGLSHDHVVRHVLFVDLVLVALAVAAARGWVGAALISAPVMVLWLLVYLGIPINAPPNEE
ncbi:MAG: glycosyltransferase family 4 protein [Proteobacteria bacterium]|nr:glycosyltransferase family 4 protein [Pseudomonadota bacterium]